MVIGTIFGLAGIAVVGLIGGTFGYMAGSKVGELVAKGRQKLREGAVKVTETIGRKISSEITAQLQVV